LDLDAWINNPPSDSEDESVTTNSRRENSELFYGGNEEKSNQNAYHNDTSSYPKSRDFVEPTVEELEKQRENRKQTEHMNPFYLKDTKKSKLPQKVPFKNYFCGVLIPF
jgi:hypothetical protein